MKFYLQKYYKDYQVIETALNFPRSVTGEWSVELPQHENLKVFELQDNLTASLTGFAEIDKIVDCYTKLENIVVLSWHMDIQYLYPNLQIFYVSNFHHLELHSFLKRRRLIEHVFNNTQPRPYSVLCLNRAARPHRLELVKKLKNINSTLVTLQQYGINSPYPNIEFESYDYNNILNLLSLQETYNACDFSIVSETCYTEPGVFVTEKTIHTILALHPALYVATPGHVAKLRSYGFDVFDDVFDHSYDNEPDPHKRMEKLLESNSKLITGQQRLNRNSLLPRLENNRTRYAAGVWPTCELR